MPNISKNACRWEAKTYPAFLPAAPDEGSWISIEEATGAMLRASAGYTDSASFRDHLRTAYETFRAHGGKDLDRVSDVLSLSQKPRSQRKE